MIIHYVDWAGQPYVLIKCKNSMHYVAWDRDDCPDGVNKCDGDNHEVWHWTFDESSVNCLQCMSLMVKNEKDKQTIVP